MATVAIPANNLCAIIAFQPVDGSSTVAAINRVPNSPLITADSLYPSGWPYLIDPQVSEYEWAERYAALVEFAALFGNKSLTWKEGLWALPSDATTPTIATGTRLIIPSVRKLLNYGFDSLVDFARICYAQDMAAAGLEAYTGWDDAGVLYPTWVPFGGNYLARYASGVDIQLKPAEDVQTLWDTTGVLGHCALRDGGTTVDVGYSGSNAWILNTPSANRFFSVGSFSTEALFELIGFSGSIPGWVDQMSAAGVSDAAGVPLLASSSDTVLRTLYGGTPSADASFIQVCRTGKLLDGTTPVSPPFGGAPLPLLFFFKSMADTLVTTTVPVGYIPDLMTLRFPMAYRLIAGDTYYYQQNGVVEHDDSSGVGDLDYAEIFAAAQGVAPMSTTLALKGEFTASWSGHTRQYSSGSTGGSVEITSYSSDCASGLTTPCTWAEAPSFTPTQATLAEFLLKSTNTALVDELKFRVGTLGLFANVTLFVDIQIASVVIPSIFTETETNTRVLQEVAGDPSTWETTSQAYDIDWTGELGTTPAGVATAAFASLFPTFWGPGIATVVEKCEQATEPLAITFSGATSPTTSTQMEVAHLTPFVRKTIQLKTYALGIGTPALDEIVDEAELTQLVVDAVGAEAALESLFNLGVAYADQTLSTTWNYLDAPTEVATSHDEEWPVYGWSSARSISVHVGPVFAKIEYNFSHYRTSPS